jgi:hypothetical protein
MDLDLCCHVDRRYHWKGMMVIVAWVANRYLDQTEWVVDKQGERSVAGVDKKPINENPLLKQLLTHVGMGCCRGRHDRRVQIRGRLERRRWIGGGGARIERDGAQMCSKVCEGTLYPDLGGLDLCDVCFETLDAPGQK